MTPRSVAVQGFGFGVLSIATMGLLGGAPVELPTMGTIELELREAAEAAIVFGGPAQWTSS